MHVTGCLDHNINILYNTTYNTQQASITTLEWWSTNMKFYTTLKMYRNHAGVFIILCQNSKDHLAEISQ